MSSLRHTHRIHERIFTGDSAPKKNDCRLKSLGCWTDTADRAISGGFRFNSDNPIEDCLIFAKQQGFSVFAVQYNTECFTSADADETYQQYGESDKCKNGRGGSWAQDVYQVICGGMIFASIYLLQLTIVTTIHSVYSNLLVHYHWKLTEF